MPVRLTWDDNNPNEEAHEVYRSDQPMDVENMPPPLAVLDPDATSYDDATAEDNTTYFYRVAAVRNDVRAYSAELEVSFDPGSEFFGAQVGDEIAGGIYAGTHTIGGTDYHIVSAKQDGEIYGLQWKTTDSTTTGTLSEDDGKANTLAMETAGLAAHPAAQHCLGYAGGGFTDWYMPARNELTLLYDNLRTHPEFTTNASSAHYTWTSTEFSSNNVWIRRLADGLQNVTNKGSVSRRVRPIRRVPV